MANYKRIYGIQNLQAGTNSSRPVRPRRGEDDKGRDGRPSTKDAQNWLMRQILVLKLVKVGNRNKNRKSSKKEEKKSSARAPCQGWQSDRRRTTLRRCLCNVQHVSFEYFTSRGCSTSRGEEVNWVTTIPNSLPLYLICRLGPASRTPLLVQNLHAVRYLRSPRLLSSGRPWRRPVQDEDDTVQLDD